jgi:hypothetical protein
MVCGKCVVNGAPKSISINVTSGVPKSNDSSVLKIEVYTSVLAFNYSLCIRTSESWKLTDILFPKATSAFFFVPPTAFCALLFEAAAVPTAGRHVTLYNTCIALNCNSIEDNVDTGSATTAWNCSAYSDSTSNGCTCVKTLARSDSRRVIGDDFAFVEDAEEEGIVGDLISLLTMLGDVSRWHTEKC